ncbi:MAG: response regulator transcription factor [Gallionella sp.]|nr:response regulator transcription factor [Gallionella sp.]MDH4286806.1 response regulator transcription factor [Gallionella sp.]
MIRILIADDHNVVRQGLTLILESNPGMKVVASCTNGSDALAWLRKHECDVALVDIAMPDMNGIDLLNHLRKEMPRLPVLILSAYPEDQYAVRLIKAGAAGYINKVCAPDEIVAAVHSVLAGKRYISPAVVEMLANELSLPEGKLPHETLSNRELQIFMLLASAKTYAEIAETLKLSVKTVSTYRNRILEKMQMQNNAELMHYAISKNLMQQT